MKPADYEQTMILARKMNAADDADERKRRVKLPIDLGPKAILTCAMSAISLGVTTRNFLTVCKGQAMLEELLAHLWPDPE